MLDYLINTAAVVPVVLTNSSTGLAHAGVVFGSVSVTIYKADGATSVSYTPTAGQWVEKTVGVYSGSGRYNLTIPAGDTDQAGTLFYAVSVAGDDLFEGVISIQAVTVSSLGAAIALIPTNPLLTNDARLPVTLIASQADITSAITSIEGIDSVDLTTLSNTVMAAISETIGLLHKNAVVDGQTYNAGGRLTSATLKVYDTDINATLNDGITGLLKRYLIFSTYDITNHETLYRLIDNSPH